MSSPCPPCSKPSAPCVEGQPTHTSSSGHFVQPTSSLSSMSRADSSLAFKSWAHGRCYRCLARNHQVSSCRDSFRCIRCRRPGHKERQCHLRSPSSEQRPGSPSQRNCLHDARSWADVVASSPPNGHHGHCRLRPIIVLDVVHVVVIVKVFFFQKLKFIGGHI